MRVGEAWGGGEECIGAIISGFPVRSLVIPVSLFPFLLRLYRRFREEKFTQLAASLSFTTLLSIVPLVAVLLAIASVLPFFGTLLGQIDNFLVANLLPGKTGGVVAKYTYQFSQKASRLTVAGLVILAVTALMLMSSIEKAFNHLWQVARPRAIWQRLGLYGVVMVLGPLVAGALLAISSFVITKSLGFFGESPWLRQTLLKALAALLLCGFFTFLYYAVPNAAVRKRHALIGGLLATAGVAGLQYLFEAYLLGMPTYTLIYGAFATLPIFLLWTYLCWVVVLIGALVVANFEVPPGGGGRGRRRKAA